jgi:hypothetical protein
MCAIQRQNQFQQDRQPQQPLPENQQPQYRFRWELYFGVPITIGLFLWFVSGMDIGFEFSDIAGLLGATRVNRYVLLGGLGVLCVTALCIIKLFKKR